MAEAPDGARSARGRGCVGRYDAAVASNGSSPARSHPTADASRTLLLAVTGMTCEHCQHHVAEALTSVEGVSSADVNLERGVATVEFHGTTIPDAKLRAAVEGAGYEASVLEGPHEGP